MTTTRQHITALELDLRELIAYQTNCLEENITKLEDSINRYFNNLEDRINTLEDRINDLERK